MNLSKEPAKRSPRVALYLKAPYDWRNGSEIYIHDQRCQLRAYCRERRWVIVDEIIGENDTREDCHSYLRAIMGDVVNGEYRFEKIVVYSYNLFVRDVIDMELTTRLIQKHNIDVVSITQEVRNDEPEFFERLVSRFDERVSRENSKNLKRKLRENAKAGFWCGGTAPYGFRTYVAEMHGRTARKKLEVEPLEAEVVQRMFDLLEKGDGVSGPMEAHAITAWLNKNGYRTRRGKSWTVRVVDRLLTNCALKGVYLYGNNADAETAIQVSIPAIIPVQRFDRVQKILRSQTSKKPAIG